jgi:hypothetical protein
VNETECGDIRATEVSSGFIEAVKELNKEHKSLYAHKYGGLSPNQIKNLSQVQVKWPFNKPNRKSEALCILTFCNKLFLR